MKIYSQQLPQYLKQKLAPCYLISGDETFLVEEACDLVRKAAVDQGINDRDCFVADKGFAWQNFITATKNFSLFSDSKLVELHLASAKVDVKGAEILQAYLQNPSQDKILLIVAPKLEAGWQKIKWLQMVDEKGIFLQIWQLENKQLSGWVANRLRSKGLIANAAVCNLLAEKAEGNLLALAQEIEKLSLLYGSGNLDIEKVALATQDNAHYNIFLLVDTALEGDVKKVIAIFENLRGEGVEPILILWALARDLRLLNELSLDKNTGSFEKICQTNRVFPKRIPLLRKAVSRHKRGDFSDLLQNAARIDCVMKGAEVGDVWRELLQLTLRLSGKNA